MKNKIKILYRKLCFLYYGKIEQLTIKYRNEYFTRKIINSCKCGREIKINGRIFITHSNLTIIGNNVHIGDHCYFYTRGGLIIGDNTHISRNVTIYTSNHNYDGSALPYDNTYIEKPVTIGNNVWIGMNVSIAPGVEIGDGAIIGIGTVVANNIKENEIVANQPFRVIKKRNEKTYKTNLENRKFGGINGNLLEKATISTFAKKGTEIQSKMFFIASTGRSGSASIAKVINQNPNILCKHEAQGQLIRLSTEYEHHLKSREDVLKELKSIYYTAGYLSPDKFYGESDQKIGNLIHLYHDILPEAKFIWLIRNPIDNVISMYSRGWFSDYEFGIDRNIDTPKVFSAKVFSQYRLNGWKTAEFQENEWNKMHPFERNCWYWNYWNKKIENQLKQLDSTKYVVLNLEKLEYKIGQINDLIGLPDFNYKTEVSNTAKYELIDMKNLSSEFSSNLEKWCLPYWREIVNKYDLQ